MARRLESPWQWEESTGQLMQSGSRKGCKPVTDCMKNKTALLSAAVMQEMTQSDSKVTLEDIKAVAVSLLSEESVISARNTVTKLFDDCYRTDQMNKLLWCSLLYYDSFLHHKEASNNENLSISGIVGENAREELQRREKQMNRCQSNLGWAYSHFITGLDNWNCHHTKGGRSRVSKTHTDQMFFEILYEFVMLCVWICFGYEKWETIHKELGKFLRTSAFNRDYNTGSRDKSAVVEGLGSISKDSDKYLSYRVYYDRPPVGSLQLRSPALVNILPHPMEAFSFGRKSQDLDWCSQLDENSRQPGILGDKISHYNPQTLRPLAGETTTNT